MELTDSATDAASASSSLLPDVYVICLAREWERRGSKTIEYLERNVDAAQRGRVVRFDAITPADFVLEDVVSTSQLSVIRGLTQRLTRADMGKAVQVACYLSHVALWQVCADSGRPIVVAEDDSRPIRVSERFSAATALGQAFDEAAVLMHCAKLKTTCNNVVVESFLGMGMYYLTPNAARQLLAHAMPAAMHVDAYMSKCISVYNLDVRVAVPWAADQDGGSSTLEHGGVIVTEQQGHRVFILSGVVTALSVVVVVVLALFVAAKLSRKV